METPIFPVSTTHISSIPLLKNSPDLFSAASTNQTTRSEHPQQNAAAPQTDQTRPLCHNSYPCARGEIRGQLQMHQFPPLKNSTESLTQNRRGRRAREKSRKAVLFQSSGILPDGQPRNTRNRNRRSQKLFRVFRVQQCPTGQTLIPFDFPVWCEAKGETSVRPRTVDGTRKTRRPRCARKCSRGCGSYRKSNAVAASFTASAAQDCNRDARSFEPACAGMYVVLVTSVPKKNACQTSACRYSQDLFR